MLDMRRKYLQTLPESAYATAKQQIVDIVADAVQAPAFFSFEELASIPSVQQLSKEPLGLLLGLLVDGSVAEYHDFIRAKPDALSSLGLNDANVLRKMRILALASIGAERQGVPVQYADIAKSLDVAATDVETWVIDGRTMPTNSRVR